LDCRDVDSANMIHLPLGIVVSVEIESIDELTDLVHNKFSSINNTGRKAEKFTGQPCLPEHLQVKYCSFNYLFKSSTLPDATF